ncbi:hypothetical protein ACIA5A_04920 [Micromonospora sp. NPDC051300]|uniref:hypothetical protein n=1 Tax=Micromonospora sp. NPDC051300 TaxID=3364286 RepID=UPI0037B2E250
MAPDRDRWIRPLAIAAIVLGLGASGLFVAVVIVWAKSFGPADEAPKVTDWLQAWASVGALVAGLLAAIFTGGLLRYEISEGRRARREQELVGPRAVISGIPDFEYGDGGLIKRVSLCVYNYGPAPIRRVLAVIESSGTRITLFAPVLGPGDSEDLTWLIERDAAEALEESLPAYTVALMFIDSTALWSRVDNGEPKKLTILPEEVGPR